MRRRARLFRHKSLGNDDYDHHGKSSFIENRAFEKWHPFSRKIKYIFYLQRQASIDLIVHIIVIYFLRRGIYLQLHRLYTSFCGSAYDRRALVALRAPPLRS